MKLNMGAKIGISLLTLTLVFLVFGSFAYVSLSKIAADVSDIRLAQERAFLAVRIELNYTGAVLQMRRYLADGLPAYRESALQGYSEVLQQENRLLELTQGEDEQARVGAVIQKTGAYLAAVTGTYLPGHEREKLARAAGSLDRANELAVENQALVFALTSQAQEIQAGLRTVSAQNEEIINTKLKSVSEASAGLVRAIWLLSLAALLAAVLLGYRPTKSNTAPLKVLTQGMDERAPGHF